MKKNQISYFLTGIKYAALYLLIGIVSYSVEHFVFTAQYNFYRLLFVLSIGFLVSHILIFRSLLYKKSEYAFLFIVLVSGTVLVLSAPRSEITWDEEIHYRISENLASSVIDGPTRPYPVSSSFSFVEQEEIDRKLDDAYRVDGQVIEGKRSFLDFYRQLGHIPGAIGIILGRIFQVAPHLTYVFGRWMNLFVYSLLIFFAIKKLKSGKLLMAVIALFPTTLFIASNYGYDPWVTSFSMLGIAYLFSAAQSPERKISLKEMLIIIFSFLFGLGPKAIYFLLFLLIFLLPKKKFHNLRQYWYFMATAIFSMLLLVSSFALPLIIDGSGEGDLRGGEGVNPGAQIRLIIEEPFEYMRVMQAYLNEYFSNQYAEGGVTFFAYLGFVPGYHLILAVLLFVILLDRGERDKFVASWRSRTIIYLTSATTVVLIISVLYVVFNPAGSKTIGGVQTRYLLPLLFPVLYSFGTLKIKSNFKKSSFALIIFTIMTFLLLQGIWELVISKYY